MKKTSKWVSLILAVVLILSFAAGLSACGKKNSDEEEGFSVMFLANGGSFSTPGGPTSSTSQTVKDGKKASKPDVPTKENRAFGGWYSDPALKQSYDFNTPVKADLTLYAKWNRIPGSVTPGIVAPGESEFVAGTYVCVISWDNVIVLEFKDDFTFKETGEGEVISSGTYELDADKITLLFKDAIISSLEGTVSGDLLIFVTDQIEPATEKKEYVFVLDGAIPAMPSTICEVKFFFYVYSEDMNHNLAPYLLNLEKGLFLTEYYEQGSKVTNPELSDEFAEYREKLRGFEHQGWLENQPHPLIGKAWDFSEAATSSLRIYAVFRPNNDGFRLDIQLVPGIDHLGRQIGRASCRERV